MTNKTKPISEPPGERPEFFPAPIRHVIITKTTTVAKTVQYEAISRYRNLPIHFINLTDVLEGFIVADENTNDRLENARLKMQDPENLSEQLRNPKSALRRVLRDRLKVFGIDDKNVQYHWAVEDSTMTAEIDEWRILHDRLQDYVPENLLQGIAKNGNQAGPAAETGPVLADVTQPVLFDELRQARLKLKKAGSPRISSISTFILSSVVDTPLAPDKVFEGQTYYRVMLPGGLDAPIPLPTTPIIETEDYYARDDDPSLPQSSAYLQWLVLHSPRSKVVSKIAAHLGCAAPEIEPEKLFTAAATTTFIRRVAPVKLPDVVCFGESEDRIGRFRIRTRIPKEITPQELNIEQLLETTDAMIFKGIGERPAPDKTLYLLHYYNALVDRQTRSRAKHRPMIVVDDGSLTQLTDFGTKLYDLGFVKNYFNRPVYQGKSAIVTDPDIFHYSDGYMDVIRSATGKPMTPEQERAAINQILEFRFAFYEPFVAPIDHFQMPTIGGASVNPMDVTVTFYTSASNDNRKVMDSNFAYAKFLAENGFAAAWGGGDLHAMGAFLKGYQAGNGHQLICVSTYNLLQNETSQGRVAPGVHRWEIYPDITQRRDSLHQHGDIEVVAWGGYGTMEEDVNGEAWRIADPVRLPAKFKIFFAPGIHRDDASPNVNTDLMRMMHGNKFVDALLKDHRSMLDKGYVLATTREELEALTLELKERIVEYRSKHGVPVVVSTSLKLPRGRKMPSAARTL